MSLGWPNARSQNEGETAGSSRVTQLAVDQVDTDGRQLGLSFEWTDYEAVAARDVLSCDHTVRLEVLSASHRVKIRPTKSSRWVVSETVACGLASSSIKPLPATHNWTEDGWSLSFLSKIEFGDVAVVKAMKELDLVKGQLNSLVVRFPGNEAALTGLELQAATESEATGMSWRTWHLYPGEDAHVVRTTTTAIVVPDVIHQEQAWPGSIAVNQREFV